MKKILASLSLALLALFANAQTPTPTIAPGTIAPAISLINIDGKTVSLDDYPSAKGYIVIFTCNTCPYSKAYEQRINELNKVYLPKGFPVIAINPNDPEASTGDTFEKMKAHAKTVPFTFPYLYDKGQVITALYGARSTPHAFVIAKKATGNIVAYAGAIDNDTPNTDPGKIKYVEEAVNALLNDQKPVIAVTKAIGCRVKWKMAE